MTLTSMPQSEKKQGTHQAADFRPFTAWRYNAKSVRPDDVIAPPYDVISPEGQTKLYEKSPHNCVRLILNKEESSDRPESNRYTRARDFFKKWQAEGVLTRDSKPCFYLYRETFLDPRDGKNRDRFALLGVLRLEPFEKGIVIPHEKTLAKPRADRMKLLEATQTNFSPVFGLFEDSAREVSKIYSAVLKNALIFEATDDEKVRHSVWAIDETSLIEKIREVIARKKIYIADGHHRYQTNLEYAQARRGNSSADQPFDFGLIALVEFNDPGLVLLPTHRIVLNFDGFEEEKALKELEPFFDIKRFPSSIETELNNLPKETSAFALLFKKAQYLLILKNPEKAKSRMPAGKPDIWYSLDVNVLAHLIFASLWKLNPEQWENYLRFTQSTAKAVAAAADGQTAAVFLLRAPDVRVLEGMGEARELMPQKSTYFYPKLASGIVFYSHQ